jgi:hypothetical protein
MHLIDISEELLKEVLTSAGLDAADIETVVRNDEAETLLVERCDFRGRIGSIKRTDEGYLRGDAAVAKVGILTYFLPDGGTRKELVPAATLFHATSMDSLKLKPLTNTHPIQLVTSRTAGRKKVGLTGETVSKDGEHLKTSLIVTDAEAITSIEGGRQELSPGYRAEVLMRPGTWNGENYDGIQVRRTYNHVALCDRARGGKDLRINIDSAQHADGFAMNEDAVLTHAQRTKLPDSSFAIVTGSGDNKIRKLPIHDKAHVRNALARLPQSDLTVDEKKQALARIKSKAKALGIEVKADSLEELTATLSDNDTLFTTPQRSRFMHRITLDGVDYEADQQVINHVRRQDTRIGELEKELTALKADHEKLTAERDTLKTKNDELEKAAKDETAVKARVDARLALVTVAKAHLDEETVKKVDSMTDQDIRKAVILKRFPDTKDKLDAEDTTEEYISARYDLAVEELSKDADEDVAGSKGSAIGSQRQQAAPRQDAAGGKGGKGTRTQEQARADMEERARSSWQPPKEK